MNTFDSHPSIQAGEIIESYPSDAKMKVGIIGLGRVGSSIAFSLLFHPKVAEIVALDINKDVMEGELEDLKQAAIILDKKISFSSDPNFAQCEYVFIAAGLPRRNSSESMLDLMKRNQVIIGEIIQKYGLDPKKSYIITNPYDMLSENYNTQSCGQYLDEIRAVHGMKEGGWILDKKGYTNWGISSECYKIIGQ